MSKASDNNEDTSGEVKNNNEDRRSFRSAYELLHELPEVQIDINFTKGSAQHRVGKIPKELHEAFEKEVAAVLEKAAALYDEVIKSRESLSLYKTISEKHREGILFKEVEETGKENLDTLTSLYLDLYSYRQNEYKNRCQMEYGHDFQSGISSIAAKIDSFIEKEAIKLLENPKGILKRRREEDRNEGRNKSVSWAEDLVQVEAKKLVQLEGEDKDDKEKDGKEELVEKYAKRVKSEQEGASR
ncbi:MAG: hypothetical protein K0R25_1123 [Rickettsiaceae bacterium]|jgi:hypothetical protein|nr:hypothetical protein [Rickettsiaceae bacterium]